MWLLPHQSLSELPSHTPSCPPCPPHSLSSIFLLLSLPGWAIPSSPLMEYVEPRESDWGDSGGVTAELGTAGHEKRQGQVVGGPCLRVGATSTGVGVLVGGVLQSRQRGVPPKGLWLVPGACQGLVPRKSSAHTESGLRGHVGDPT